MENSSPCVRHAGNICCLLREMIGACGGSVGGAIQHVKAGVVVGLINPTRESLMYRVRSLGEKHRPLGPTKSSTRSVMVCTSGATRYTPANPSSKLGYVGRKGSVK